MKAILDLSGQLTVSGETDVEQYALRMWYTEWLNHRAGLQVAIAESHKPGSVKFRPISAPVKVGAI